MKLRNKKTGEIREVKYWQNLLNECGSLTKLNEEWEDYEEPKELYWVNYDGSISHAEEGTMSFVKQKQIGNYFETREECDKAVEKLKAWKRMKDTGCKPIMWRWRHDYPNDACYVEVTLKCQFDSGVHDRELNLLFGGEE